MGSTYSVHRLCQRNGCGHRFDQHTKMGTTGRALCPDDAGFFYATGRQDFRAATSYHKDEVKLLDLIFTYMEKGQPVTEFTRNKRWPKLRARVVAMKKSIALRESARKLVDG